MKTSSGGNGTKVPFYRLRRFVLLLVLLVVIALTLAVTSYTYHFFNNGMLGCGSSTPVSTRFTVIIDYIIRHPLPTINTTQGQTITIHVWNNSTGPSGFVIQHYFEQGATLHAGQSCDLTFSVSQPGIFGIHSNEPDPWFSFAVLNVNPST